MLSQLYTGVQYLQPLHQCKTPEQLKRCALAWSTNACELWLAGTDAAIQVPTPCQMYGAIWGMLSMAGCTQPCISRAQLESEAADVLINNAAYIVCRSWRMMCLMADI